jgi:hypothetical protein
MARCPDARGSHQVESEVGMPATLTLETVFRFSTREKQPPHCAKVCPRIIEIHYKYL